MCLHPNLPSSCGSFDALATVAVWNDAGCLGSCGGVESRGRMMLVMFAPLSQLESGGRLMLVMLGLFFGSVESKVG